MSRSRSQLMISSGSFTVPANVSSLFITMTAGGGGGGSNSGIASDPGAGGGGGSGEFCQRRAIVVTPGQVITVTLGSAGTGSAFGALKGGDGGTSTFGSVISLQGGKGGSCSDVTLTNALICSNGGGAGGGGINGPWNAHVAVEGTLEDNICYGGSSGGYVSAGGIVYAGAPCAGWSGGAAGSGTNGSGSGGGASVFGAGGAGGRPRSGSGPNDAFDGEPPPASAYGAGGGGSGNRTTGQFPVGGSGRGGACLIEWVA